MDLLKDMPLFWGDRKKPSDYGTTSTTSANVTPAASTADILKQVNALMASAAPVPEFRCRDIDQLDWSLNEHTATELTLPDHDASDAKLMGISVVEDKSVPNHLAVFLLDGKVEKILILKDTPEVAEIAQWYGKYIDLMKQRNRHPFKEHTLRFRTDEIDFASKRTFFGDLR